jgi:regulator of replication initiation timing
MAKSDVVLGTVKTMLDSGIDDQTIIDTLSDTGISPTEARALIAKAKSGAADNLESDENLAPRDEKIASKAADKVKAHIDQKSEEDAMNQTAVHAAMQEHSMKLDEVHDDIKDLKSRFSDDEPGSDDSASAFSGADSGSASNGAVLFRLTKMETQISELSATSSALRTLLQKILDNNREILFELQKKK